MEKFLSTFLALTALVISGCASKAPEKTSLELQAFQRHEFDTNKKIGFASTLSVFQDLGYIIRNANIESGLIQAASPTKSVVFLGSHMSNMEATAFVEETPSQKTAIRLNFVAVSEDSSGYGMKSRSDKPVLDPKIYENAFVKIQEAIFIRTKTQ